MTEQRQPNPLRVGIGGPVGSGKTALMDRLCKKMRGRFELVAITTDIYTREDAEFLTKSGALPPERIRGVETGGCPHTAIREDASINLAAIAEMTRLFPAVDIVLIESGGDNLAATFSPELADLTIYVIDVVWVDLLKTDPSATAFVERATRLQLPTVEEISEIESSSRLRAENSVLYLSAPLVHRATGGAPQTTPVGFVLAADRLVTVRFEQLTAFDTLGKTPLGSAPEAFAGLIEAIIDRIA